MTDIEEKKKRLEQDKARLQRMAQKIRSEERKKQTQQLIHLGKIVKDAGLGSVDPSALLGAFLEIKERSKEPSTLNGWRAKADLEEQAVEDKVAVVVSFPSQPERNERQILKSHGLKWNDFRQEWQGHCNREKLAKDLNNSKARIEEIDLAAPRWG